jgi:hypothetical protein
MAKRVWYYLDDDFDVFHPLATNTAMGLWLLAGLWAHENTTDGIIPYHIAQQLDVDMDCHKLVALGLFSSEGPNGYHVNGFDVEPPPRHLHLVYSQGGDA